ncbi:MAG TPA: hypothetical protein VFE58_14750 [Tepidisphaeraceae bacterium]|jgi:hypothetical protein|nr:hypothetical protein [Tepidisphaeraceae bacterium]
MAMSGEEFVTVVSGLPRSGTSVMMQMLAAGGMEMLTDGKRGADVDNPAGYFELEAVKGLATDARFLEEAGGKGVKIVHALLGYLPRGREYRVIFMRRDLDEVLASQRKMLDRAGKAGAALSEEQLKGIYASQIQQALRGLGERGIEVLEVDYGALISDAAGVARGVNEFLRGKLDERAMAGAVKSGLYRNRR